MPAVRGSRLFNLCFLLMLVAGLALLLGSAGYFRHRGVLPPTPVTGTPCIDVKFDYLREHSIADATLLAVGSSVTWRNLDMAAIEQTVPAVRPVNAAMCYVHVHQTAYWADYLLPHAPNVQTVMTVVSPRDFQACPSGSDAFFDRQEADRLIFEGGSPWPIYATNLRLRGFFLQGWRALTDDFVRVELDQDAYGSAPLHTRLPFGFEFRVDERCLQALSRLEQVVRDHGARLVLVHLPTSETWRAESDPDGTRIAGFKQRVRAALQDPETLVIDGDRHPVPADQFADPMHLLWPAAGRFSRFVGEQLRPKG